MTPDELSQVLLRDEYHILDISPEDFPELESHIGWRVGTTHCQLVKAHRALFRDGGNRSS